jgi:hypothetical protein
METDICPGQRLAQLWMICQAMRFTDRQQHCSDARTIRILAAQLDAAFATG